MALETIDVPGYLETAGEASTSVSDVQPATRHRGIGDSVFRGFLANFSVQPLTWAGTLLAAAVMPRFLGSDGVGQLTLAFTITAMAATALELGITTFLTRRIAQTPGNVARDLGVALVIQAVVFVTGALLIAAIVPRIVPSLEFPILALALVSMIVIGNHSLLTCALRGQENHLRYAWINAAPAVISAFGASLALFLGADLLVDTVVGVGLDVVVIACCWKPSGLRPIFPRVNLSFVRTAREFVYGGLPFVGWNLTMAFYGGIDRILLGFFVSSSELGWYGAAYRIIGIPIFIPNLVITPLFPALSRSQQEPDALRRVIAQVLRAVLVLMVPLSAAICVLAPEIPTLLGWPADFENSVPLMQILSIQVPIVGFDMVLGAVLMSLGLERRWMWVGLIAAVINVACNLVAIPFFQHTAQNGPIGAALVTVMTEVMMSIGAIALLPKQVFDKHILWSTTPRVVVAGIGAGLVAAWLMPVALILAAVAGAATYLALGLALRIISTDDMQIVRARLMRAHA